MVWFRFRHCRASTARRAGRVRCLTCALALGLALSAGPRLARGQTAGTPAPASTAPEEPELSDQAELARVVSLYEAGRYAECASELGRLLGPGPGRTLSERQVVERARIYHAACLIGSGKPELADAPLKAAIEANLMMEPPDSLVFPPPVVQRFLKVRESMHDMIRKKQEEDVKRARALAAAREAKAKAERARVRALEELASQETVIVRNRRWIGFVPFGVGQFQNGDTGLGWVFFSTEALLAGTALTALSVRTYIQADLAEVPVADEVDVNARLSGWQTTLEVSTYALLGVAAIGILEAQLSFKPETREIRKRELPKHLRPPQQAELRPLGGITPDGFTLGVRGSF